MDAALECVPAQVVFLHGALPPGGVRKILLPSGENVHTRLALELAPALLGHVNAALEVALVRSVSQGYSDRLLESGPLSAPGSVPENASLAALGVLNGRSRSE